MLKSVYFIKDLIIVVLMSNFTSCKLTPQTIGSNLDAIGLIVRINYRTFEQGTGMIRSFL